MCCNLFSRLDKVFSKPYCPSVFSEKVTEDCALLIELLMPSLGSQQDWACTNSLIIAHYFEAYYCISCAFVLHCTEYCGSISHDILCHVSLAQQSLNCQLYSWAEWVKCMLPGPERRWWRNAPTLLFWTTRQGKQKYMWVWKHSQCNTLHWDQTHVSRRPFILTIKGFAFCFFQKVRGK